MITFRGLALSISIAAATLLVGVGRPIATAIRCSSKPRFPSAKCAAESITWRLIWRGSGSSLPNSATTPSGSSTSRTRSHSDDGGIEGAAGRRIPAVDGCALRRKRGRWIGAHFLGSGLCRGRADRSWRGRRQYPRGQRRQSNSGRIWQWRLGRHRRQEFSRGSRTFHCPSIRKVFNSIPQAVGCSSISPRHAQSQSWIADPGSRRQTGPSRSPATISQWRSVETPGKSSPFSATLRSSPSSRSKTARSWPVWTSAEMPTTSSST